jgi:hypothetical protein
MNLHTLTASLQAGTYDSKRKQIYFTDKSQIQVFSVSSGSWLSPIAVPQAVTAQLVGISLSNDGSVLAVGDQGNGAILTLNPDAPASSIRAFSAPNGSFGLVPGGLAVSNQGVVYFLIGFNYAAYGGRCQSSLFWKLDSTTGAFTDLSSSSSWCDDRQNRVLLSSDQSTVYIDADGQLKVYFPSSGTLAEVPEPNYGQSDMALSSDGSRLVQQDGVYSDTGAGLGELAWSEIDLSDSQNPTWGQKVDQAGGILLQPWSNALDLMDLSHFILRKRIALPNTVTNAFDPLVFDEDNDHAYLIVSGGVLEVPLAPLPIVLDRLNPSSGAAGSTVTLIGSGFTTDTTAEVDGTSTPVSFIDEHKMSMTLPSHALGSSRITLHRGDGDSSYLDVAFTYSSGTAPLSTRFEMKPVTKQASRITTTKSKPRQ